MLTVTATAANKIYDGGTSATVTSWTTNAVSGDSVSVAYTAAAFATEMPPPEGGGFVNSRLKPD